MSVLHIFRLKMSIFHYLGYQIAFKNIIYVIEYYYSGDKFNAEIGRCLKI